VNLYVHNSECLRLSGVSHANVTATTYF